MTPSMYEAKIQVFKTPENMMKAYRKLESLKDQKNEGEITNEGMRELAKLERLNELVLDFEKSHKYMMEKENFNQQDVDYAFSLEKKEYPWGGVYHPRCLSSRQRMIPPWRR